MAEKPQRGYATNLASAFLVLSALYRLGLEAHLTLGYKKGVDIVVTAGQGRPRLTIEVTSVAGTHDWLVGQLGTRPKDHHFVVLLCYETAFADPDAAPSLWLFRRDDITSVVRTSTTGSVRYIPRKQIRDQIQDHLGNWDLPMNALNNTHT